MDRTIRRKITREARRCLDIANRHFNRRFAMPKIKYDLDGNAAGTAYPIKWTIRLNGELLTAKREHLSYFLNQTVPHEIAHLIDLYVNIKKYAKMKRIPLHGREWKKIMVLFKAEPQTRHPLETFSKKKLVKNHHYICPRCNADIILGPKNHHKLQTHHRMKADIIKCGHSISHRDYLGLSEGTRRHLAQKLSSHIN